MSNSKTVQSTNVRPSASPSVLTKQQMDALKTMISNMASRPAMLRWEYEQGRIKWDCKDLHNSMIDWGVATAAPFGQWAVDYYATCYRNLLGSNFEYL